MSFPIDASSRTGKYSSDSYPKKMITSQLCYFLEARIKVQAKCEGISGENGTKGRCHDSRQADDKENEVAFKERPVLNTISTIVQLTNCQLRSADSRLTKGSLGSVVG
jgi:hypothetical protein